MAIPAPPKATGAGELSRLSGMGGLGESGQPEIAENIIAVCHPLRPLGSEGLMRLLLAVLLWLSIAFTLPPTLSPRELSATEPPSATQPEEATATNDQVDQVLLECAHFPHMHLQTIGRTVEQRPIRMLVVTAEGIKRPARDNRLVVLLVGGIHSGEAAGKEALLTIAQQLRDNPQHPWLKELVLLLVPNFNADGNSRRAANRPRQNGPPQTGTRENAQGLDLNRDFMKLDSPECRAMVDTIHRWDVDLLMDLHTTNGSHHRYQLTYDTPHHPATDARIVDHLRQSLLPTVTDQLEKHDAIPTFFYGNFNDKHTRWTTFGYEGRYSTEYMGLRGKLAILVEAYAYADFSTRIQATRRFTEVVLDRVADESATLRRILADVRRDTVRAGRRPLVGDTIALQGKLALTSPQQTVRGFKPPDSDQPHDYEVEYFGSYMASRQVQRVFAYAIPSEETRLLRRLQMHGIRLDRLVADVPCRLETANITKLNRGVPFQGHVMQEASVEWNPRDATLPIGTVLVKMDQPLATLAASLLEPEAADSFVSWGFLRERMTEAGADYPITRLPAPTEVDTQPLRTIEPRQQLTLDQIYGPTGSVPFGGGFPIGIRWHPSEDAWLEQDGVLTVQVDALTGQRSTFQDRDQIQKALETLPEMDRDAARRLSSQLRTLSPSWDAVLWSHDGDLFYHKFGEATARRLTIAAGTERMPTFSPDGRWVAFVRDRNLFIVSVEDGRERQLTNGGEHDFYGELDWVYQEEIYGRGNFKGFWWSPDSEKLALLHLDEKEVRNFTIVDHQSIRGETEVTAYPKSGDPIPKARLGWIDVSNGEAQWLEVPRWSGQEHLFVRVSWTPDSQAVLTQIQDRVQTTLELHRWQLGQETSSVQVVEQSPAWVEVLEEPIFLADNSFLWLSHRDGYRHIYRVAPDGVTRQLTRGDWEVRSLLGIDPQQRWVYFQAADPLRRQAYRIPLEGGRRELLSDARYSHSWRMSSSKSYAVDYYSAIHQPPAARLVRGDGQVVRTLQANLEDRLQHYAISPPEFLEITARDGHPLDAMLIKPADFDPNQKYPVIVYVYSGPQAPVVQDRWSGTTYLWHQYLAQQGFLIWMCDNRSSSYRSIRDAFPIHRNLGKHELSDITDGVRWLTAHDFVDAERIGIWGWSYGGYMTGYAMTHSRLFRAGIAGAPVTDWRHYDAVYTERFMGTPQSNPAGYEASSVTKAAADLHGRLFVIHGTIDDNVHLSNTLQLAQALQFAQRDFQLMLYPGNRHSIGNAAQNRHLREQMTQFFLRELK